MRCREMLSLLRDPLLKCMSLKKLLLNTLNSSILLQLERQIKQIK